MKIRRAIVSVAEKMGVADFAASLAKMGVEILSTGRTAHLLEENDVPVRRVEEYTGQPTLLGGRMRTLHPKIHGGILNVRGDPAHESEKTAHGYEDIDLVVVNLYPFDAAVTRPGVRVDDAVRAIDVGGPTLIRAAAMNWRHVAAVVDHGDYARVLEEMHARDGGIGEELRFELAKKVFSHTARYDSMVATWLEEHDRDARQIEEFPQVLRLELTKVMNLRYGENPHQRAALYVRRHADEASAASARQLSGKELSFNNLLDATVGLEIVKEFPEPAAAVVKHTNPCGVAVAKDLARAFHAAFDADPVSDIDAVVGFNRRVDATTARDLARPDANLQVIIAPSFDDEALEVLTNATTWGATVRLLAAGGIGRRDRNEFDIRAITGGFLRQDRDLCQEKTEDLAVVTARAPTESELAGMRFAWSVAKHVKSNAIVIALDGVTRGVGGGQMSRLDAAFCAVRKAGQKARGAIAASDSHFCAPSELEILAAAGVTAVIQPGGAVHDDEVIALADAMNVAVAMTPVRHFCH
jgi:phosphoribosylaminoimidazolecarboxamide formyltransferase/IMP cyclohydrolase